MITLNLAYNDNSEDIANDIAIMLKDYPLVKFISFHENILSERKKAFKLKGGFSARETPFAVLYDKDKKPIRAFYSEANECTVDNIKNTLNKIIPYENKSN